jgi:hypothetical protein
MQWSARHVRSAVLLTALFTACTETGSVAGVVRDAYTLQPIPGALLRVEGTVFEETTDIVGRYSIGRVSEGWYYVSAQAAGYHGDTLLAPVMRRRTTTCDFGLEELLPRPAAVLVDTSG